LSWEDLEDAYSQATLELVARARRAPFQSHAHIANALEQKFLSRIDDRRRAIGGRSAMEAALAGALPVDEPDSGAGEIEDRGAEVLHKVARRLELQRVREVIADLTEDQRLVLAAQVTLQMDCAEFCARYHWSPEKYRKVAQRARARLRMLLDSHQSGERCRMLEPDIAAHVAGALEGARAARVLRHLENCRHCARQVHDLERASRQVAALLPVPPLALPLIAKAGLLARATTVATRRFAPFAGRGGAHAGSVTAGAGGGAFGAGGSFVGAGIAKLGVAAACVAGAAGGLALCSHVGLINGGAARHGRHVASVARPVATGIGSPRFGSVPAPRSSAAVLATGQDAGRGRAARADGSSSGSAQSQARLEFGSLARRSVHASGLSSFEASGPGAISRSADSAPPRQRGEFSFER
jgi:DNA-directed RNA polymerase specialized sigma24 family protein